MLNLIQVELLSVLVFSTSSLNKDLLLWFIDIIRKKRTPDLCCWDWLLLQDSNILLHRVLSAQTNQVLSKTSLRDTPKNYNKTIFTKMYLFYSRPYQQDREGSSQESRLRPGSGRCQRDMETPILESGQGDSSIRWDTEWVSLLLQLSQKGIH